MTNPVATGPVTHWVPARELGARQLEALHDHWDHKRADEHASASAIASKLPTKPLSRARENPTQGSRSYLHLMARAAVKKGGGPNLLAPVASTASWMASALAPAINVGTSGIGAVTSTFSNAMASGVNEAKEAIFETKEAIYEKSHQLTSTVQSSAGSRTVTDIGEASRRGSNERQKACRFMQPMLQAA